jgi:hypothetical protein
MYAAPHKMIGRTLQRVILKKSPVSQLAVRAYSAAGRMRPQLELRVAQEAVIDAD